MIGVRSFQNGVSFVFYRLLLFGSFAGSGMAFIAIRERWAKTVLRFVFLLSFILVSTRLGSATTVIVPSDDDLIIGARLIIRGRVLSQATSFDEQRNMVFTYVTLRVQEVLKGQVTARRIVIKEPGGVAGDRGAVIHGAPVFHLNENVIVYLDTWPDGSLRVHQMYLGKFSIERDPATGEQIVVRQKAGPYVDVLPQSLSAGEARPVTDRMELSTYSAMVRAKLSANWYRAQEFESVHYNGIPVLPSPAGYNARVASGLIQPQYTFLSPSAPLRWFEPDSGQPVVFLVKPDGAPSSQITDDVTAAMTAWSSVSGSSLRLQMGGTTSQCGASGSINTIAFDNCDRQFSASPTCAGVLAVGGASYTPSQSKVVNGTTFFRAGLGHISFNPFANCHFSQRCNLQEVLTHELGHTIGLGHSNDSSATMYALAHFDGRCAGLRADDVNGVTFIYPSGAGGGGGGSALTVTSSSPLTSGVVGSPFSQTLSASGGTPPYSWSLISGSTPPGISLGSNGVLAGIPSGAGTFAFTIRVTDAVFQTADKSLSVTISSPGGGGGSGQSLNAVSVSQNVPAIVPPSQGFNVSMTWRNTGTATWSEAAGVRVGSQNPANNITWGGNRIVLPSTASIAAGQTLSVTLTVFAPSAPGTYNFQWQMVKDGVFFGDPSSNVAINVTSAGAINITSPSALEAARGVSFSHQLSATGGTAPYTWSIISGILPAGLTLNSSGIISGTPLAVGTLGFTVQARDSASRTADKLISISVTNPPVQVTTSSLARAVQGSNYTQQLNATGGSAPYVWLISGGSLPPGLSLNRESGIISGTPTLSGSFGFSATASDRIGSTASKSFVLSVLGPEAVPRITKVKYKPGGRKLIVTGQNFGATAVLVLDGLPLTPRSVEPTTIVAKPVSLSPGSYVLLVVNSNGISSESVSLTVN